MADNTDEVVRGERGKFVKTGGRPKGTVNGARTRRLPSEVARRADMMARLVHAEGERSMEEVLANIAAVAKTDAQVGIAFAKLILPPTPRKFAPSGSEMIAGVDFVHRPEVIIRLAAEQVLDLDSAKFFLEAHKIQTELGFTKVLRLQLDKFNRGEIDMPAMLQALGDALMAHEAHTFEGEGERNEE